MSNTKKSLKQYCDEIEIEDYWLDSYQQFVPKFINEAKTKTDWQDWDKDVFFEFFERSNAQCVSSLRQGYFSKEERQNIKSHWNEIAPLLKNLAEKQEEPQWEVYQQIKKIIRAYTNLDRRAATNRIVASLQPNLLCTIVDEDKLWELFDKLNKYSSDEIPEFIGGNWFKNSYNICKLFQQVLQPLNAMDIITYSWQTLEHLRNIQNKQTDMNNYIKEKAKLLKEVHNLIFTGAPGTGKTYLAKQIAEEVLNENSNSATTGESKSIMEIDWATYYKLVQAESNYAGADHFTGRLNTICRIQNLFNTGKSFSDFSEDERKYIAGTQGKTQREQLGNEDSGFFGQMSGSGVFASEIKSNNPKISNALDNIPVKDDITKQNFDSFVKIFEEVFDRNMVGCASRLLAMKRPDFFICINGGNKDSLKKDFENKDIDKSFDNYWEFIQKIQQSEWWKNPTPTTDIENEVANARMALLDSIYYDGTITTLDKIAELLQNNSSNIGFVQFHPSYDYTDFVEGLRPKKETTQNEINFELKNGIFKDFCEKAKDNPNENYVFIIDEINRGEISKIFGELFFSIDPSYRGKKGAVKTQYSNMHENRNEDFYVPENVFIIGTMNDIDRSVESFDFAMRRRFTWEEITAEESAENMNLPKEIQDRMAKLNAEISTIDGLNASYHIGGAYFLDTDGKPRTDYETIWKFRLYPLLKEYLRGMSEVKEKLEKLENAYNA
ncbi:MAG: AAA family ATPase [Lentimicrobiaceae bacterium]|nr:AAA family ATPase [Lentimicrobiaceae bacterium]